MLLTLILIKAPQKFFDSVDYNGKIAAFNYSTKPTFRISNLLLFIWLIIDLIVFLKNKKYRACHDLIAGTVVVEIESKNIAATGETEIKSK